MSTVCKWFKAETVDHNSPSAFIYVTNSGFNNLHLNAELTITSRFDFYHSPGAVMGHFTAVAFDRHGLMWYHDGILTGRHCKMVEW
jgi:hypothetical protein